MSADVPDLPAFLKIPAEERAAAWKAVKPAQQDNTPQQKKETPPKPKRRGTASRIARMKEKLAMNEIPKEFRVWDTRRSQFVDSRIEEADRLRQAAARIGYQLGNEEMTKLTIVPYVEGRDLPAERGRSSIDEGASENDRHNKLIAVAKRVGAKLHRLEVVKADGALLETWLHQDGALSKDGGENLVLRINEQEPDVAKKVKRKTAKAKTNGTGKKPAGSGVIATIVETMKRASGASAEEILAVLTKKFPDRKAKSMLSTVKIQAAKHAKKKDKTEKRGLVYFG